MALDADSPQAFAVSIVQLASDSPEDYRRLSDYSMCLQQLWMRMSATITTLDQRSVWDTLIQAPCPVEPEHVE
eukprot:1028061-Amphidinium_carterae.1